ncbi:MAG: O-antigen ligase [Candidatus Paceibacteria bacterium]|jgi:O-antigen ligase
MQKKIPCARIYINIMNNKLTFIGILTAIFFFLFPFIDTDSLFYGEVNVRYFYIVSFSILLLISLASSILINKRKINLKSRKLLLITAGVLGVYYVSSFLGLDSSRSLNSDIVRSSGVWFLTAAALMSFSLSELLNKKDWNLTKWSIVISSTAFSVLSFFATDETAFGFGNSTFAGSYQMIALLVSMIVFLGYTESKKQKYIVGLMILIQMSSPILLKVSSILDPVSALGLARASSATAILAIFYVVSLIAIKKVSREKFKKVASIWSLLILVSVFSVISLLFVPGSVVQEKYIEVSSKARIIVWDIGIEAFKQNPVIGSGPENFRMVFEHNFNNDLFLKENIGEVWFDRAHNIFVDTLVSVGLVGVVSVLILIFMITRVSYIAHREDNIGVYEMFILGMLPFFHLIQMQTGFDSVASYGILVFVLGYLLWLEKESITSSEEGGKFSKVLVVILIAMAVFMSYEMLYKQYEKQSSLKEIFNGGGTEKQVEYINRALSGDVDFETLRVSSASLMKGFFVSINSVPPGTEKYDNVINSTREQMAAYDKYYVEYIERVPNDYRARMNRVYLLMNQTILGTNRLDEAKAIVEDSYRLSPENPITLVMDGLVSMYEGDFETAKEKVTTGIELNPDILFTNSVLKKIKAREKDFPNIAVVTLTNL